MTDETPTPKKKPWIRVRGPGVLLLVIGAIGLFLGGRYSVDYVP